MNRFAVALFIALWLPPTQSNGGLNAPLGDMARYLAFLMGSGQTPAQDVVLKRASLEEMWKRQIVQHRRVGVENEPLPSDDPSG